MRNAATTRGTWPSTMKKKLAATIGVVALAMGVATSFASAAPTKTGKIPFPSKGSKGSHGGNSGRPGLGHAHNLHQPFGGKLEGVFTGTLTELSVSNNGKFGLTLRDESNQAEAYLNGCGMRPESVQYLGQFIGNKRQVRVNYRKDCIVTVWAVAG